MRGWMHIDTIVPVSFVNIAISPMQDLKTQFCEKGRDSFTPVAMLLVTMTPSALQNGNGDCQIDGFVLKRKNNMMLQVLKVYSNMLK